MLSTDGLGYRYGTTWAIRGVNAELKPGITGLLGPNGAGKTTLMRLLLGLLEPSEGSVSLFGRNPAKDPTVRLQVGYLPQTFSPPASSRVKSYLEYLALLSGMSPAAARSAVTAGLESVRLTSYANRRLKELSGGMIRRVGIAQATLHSPKLLITDEPATGLDPEERLSLFDNLRELADRRPVLLSSHLVEEVEREAEHVWFLSNGKLVWAGTVQDAVTAMRGQVRTGTLPAGKTPVGRVVSRKTTSEGTVWRAIGDDDRLAVAEPTLLDAYLAHVGRPGDA